MKYLLFVCLMAVTLTAQETAEQREARHHYAFSTSRATANFRSADSIEANLRRDGAVLHPRLIALRGRIEAALGEARFEMDQHDFPSAEDALARADALLDRFAKAIGGD
jgi:hypothetical protein